MSKEDGKIWPYIMMARNWKRLFLAEQHRGDLHIHGRHFEAQLDAVEVLWGNTIPHKLVGKKSTDDQQKARKRFQVALFLESIDQQKYKHVLDSLHSDYINNKNHYKDTVDDMITLLQQRRDVVGNYRNENSFAQYEDEVDVDDVAAAYDEEEEQHQQIEELDVDNLHPSTTSVWGGSPPNMDSFNATSPSSVFQMNR